MVLFEALTIVANWAYTRSQIRVSIWFDFGGTADCMNLEYNTCQGCISASGNIQVIGIQTVGKYVSVPLAEP